MRLYQRRTPLERSFSIRSYSRLYQDRPEDGVGTTAHPAASKSINRSRCQVQHMPRMLDILLTAKTVDKQGFHAIAWFIPAPHRAHRDAMKVCQ